VAVVGYLESPFELGKIGEPAFEHRLYWKRRLPLDVCAA
jgi:hypothetical protein